MHRFRVTILLVFTSLILVGQEINLDKYKYIIVSDKFHFVKEVDGYQTSSLTKFLLEKKGFQVFLSNENFPDELSQNKCNNALFADVKDESDFLTTKSIIVLNDCKGKNIYTSKVGKSKLKEYKKAYQASIRSAFDSMTDFIFSYKTSEKSLITPEITKIDKIVVIPDSVTQKKEVVREILPSENLYAQPIPNGFQLVNTTPEVVYVLLKTGVKDIFLLKDKMGIVYKSAEKWFVEFYQNEMLVTKELKVKF
ncbi:hypothetical protein IU405_14900 [Polaribacter sp. BAL334]|uniref:hypothetical protein n=1 Tax=Polaribacter sp. BAL334 TaxID=1708178 RepID=UPI0018D1FD63|nr:hypothetical protein [Polaribacter sp. BAL334]MBG7613541.1 hypothetical protein [Polaribacter sp. BAL334]